MNRQDILIKNKIHTIRGVQVMLDSDLAELYEVPVKRLNEQVRRNMERFPEYFMFQLSEDEYSSLRSQIATLNSKRGKHRKYLPFVFTEQGVSMLSAVLKSKKAIEVSIIIINAFVEMRQFLIKNAYVFQEFQRINQKLITHDEQLEKVFQAMENKELPRQGILLILMPPLRASRENLCGLCVELFSLAKTTKIKTRKKRKEYDCRLSMIN